LRKDRKNQTNAKNFKKQYHTLTAVNDTERFSVQDISGSSKLTFTYESAEIHTMLHTASTSTDYI